MNLIHIKLYIMSSISHINDINTQIMNLNTSNSHQTVNPQFVQFEPTEGPNGPTRDELQ